VDTIPDHPTKVDPTSRRSIVNFTLIVASWLGDHPETALASIEVSRAGHNSGTGQTPSSIVWSPDVALTPGQTYCYYAVYRSGGFCADLQLLRRWNRLGRRVQVGRWPVHPRLRLTERTRPAPGWRSPNP